jgi:hypothetical protein
MSIRHTSGTTQAALLPLANHQRVRQVRDCQSEVSAKTPCNRTRHLDMGEILPTITALQQRLTGQASKLAANIILGPTKLGMQPCCG